MSVDEYLKQMNATSMQLHGRPLSPEEEAFYRKAFLDQKDKELIAERDRLAQEREAAREKRREQARRKAARRQFTKEDVAAQLEFLNQQSRMKRGKDLNEAEIETFLKRVKAHNDEAGRLLEGDKEREEHAQRRDEFRQNLRESLKGVTDKGSDSIEHQKKVLSVLADPNISAEDKADPDAYLKRQEEEIRRRTNESLKELTDGLHQVGDTMHEGFQDIIRDPFGSMHTILGDLGDLFPKKEASEEEKKEEEKKPEVEDSPDNYVEYTYKPGDTFGQVILDNGLATDKGLWGADGDVAFYDKQLHDNYNIYGNIPIGTTLKLRKRNAPELPAPEKPADKKPAEKKPANKKPAAGLVPGIVDTFRSLFK